MSTMSLKHIRTQSEFRFCGEYSIVILQVAYPDWGIWFKSCCASALKTTSAVWERNQGYGLLRHNRCDNEFSCRWDEMVLGVRRLAETWVLVLTVVLQITSLSPNIIRSQQRTLCTWICNCSGLKRWAALCKKCLVSHHLVEVYFE